MVELKQIAEKLRALREECGWTQAYVGKRVGRKRETVGLYEGSGEVPTALLKKWLELFGLTFTDFFEGNIPKHYRNAAHEALHDRLQTLFEKDPDSADEFEGRLWEFEQLVARKTRIEERRKLRKAGSPAPP